MQRKLFIGLCGVAGVASTLVWAEFVYRAAADPLLLVALGPGVGAGLLLSVCAAGVAGLWRRRARTAAWVAVVVVGVTLGTLLAARAHSARACDRLKHLEDECASGTCDEVEAYRDEFLASVCRSSLLCRPSKHGSFQFTRAHVRHELACELPLEELCNDGETSCVNGRQRTCEDGRWGKGVTCSTGACSTAMPGHCELVF